MDVRWYSDIQCYSRITLPDNNVIIVGKTPFKYSSNWSISNVVELGVGGVIDLTNTDRYYSPPTDIPHLKLKVDGSRTTDIMSTEDLENVVGFVKMVFSTGKPVFIHCTHGANRTGYVFVKIMKSMYGVPVRDAIEMFKSNRKNGLYKKEYINDLLGGESPDQI